jgi:AcrR family transcriptional regulator
MMQRTLAKQNRRRRILDAAAQLIAEDGSFSGLSMRKVAQQASVSVTTLYNLFGSKEEIRRALVAKLIDGVEHALERLPVDEPIERMEALIAISAKLLTSYGTVSRVALLASFKDPLEADPAARRSIKILRTELKAGMDAGALQNDLRADLLATQIYAGFRHAADEWACERLDANGMRDRALYALYVGLLAAANTELRPQVVASIQRVERRLNRRSRRAA